MTTKAKKHEEIIINEHSDTGSVAAKRTIPYGWDGSQDVRLAISADGYIKLLIVAEDIDDPGSYVAVQGQYNDDGNFELLTAGSGTVVDTDNLLLETGDDLLLETGDQFLME